MKPMVAVRRSLRCLSSAVLTLQCAACPAARHFFARDACREHCAWEFRRLRAARRSSALRRGLLFARTKSNQKFAKTYGFGIPFCGGFHKIKGGVPLSVRCLSLVALTSLVRPHPAGPAAHKEGLCSLVRLERCPWQASRTTKCRAAGQAAHCSVSTAEDKQRTERGTPPLAS